MDDNLHDKLLSMTEELRGIASTFTTESIVRACAMDHLFPPDESDERTLLLAQVKQVFFLLGLMLTTPEPEQRRHGPPRSLLPVVKGGECVSCIHTGDHIFFTSFFCTSEMNRSQVSGSR